MIAYIYRRKRKVEGRLELQRTYRGRFRVQGDDLRDVSLDTPDKQVAQSRLRERIQEREWEVAGLTAPASERQAVAKATLVHLTDFLADLKVDAMRPFLTARASTTKNRKEAVIPLHPSLAQELRGAKGELTEDP
ncbi:MAG: hypothetical protein RIS76_1396 [Verrucomicrobiota bacterium]